MSTPSSYRRAQGGLPRLFLGRKSIPLLRDSLLQDSEVGSIDGHCAVIAHIMGTEPALEDNLRSKEAVAARV